MDDAPRTNPVRVPLDAELRPYFALQTEPHDAPPGSRFEGWWVAVWRSRLPCVQIDRARSLPVGRALAMAGDGEREATARAIADAALFITTEANWLESAAESGVPTVYIANGHGDTVPVPGALEAFDPDRLRVLRSHTNFRRDLPLRELEAAFETFAPGAMADDRSESAKCRQRLEPYLQGRLADLGHGGHKILPRALGVDFFRYDPWDWIGDVRDLWFFDDQSFDAVYSSHCLEDLWHPHQALEEWTRILKPGGHLSLYLPLRDHYPNVGTPDANPGHKDDYVPEDVEGFLHELGHMEVVQSARRESEVSFEVIAKKKAGRSWFVQRHELPAPEVSVLVLGEVTEPAGRDVKALSTAVETSHASLQGIPHEILVLSRDALAGDDLAAVRDLAARIPECTVIEDRRPLPYPLRLERLRALARGRQLIVLQGAIPTADSLAQLHRGAEAAGADLAWPTYAGPWGQRLIPQEVPGACVLIRASTWPAGSLDESRYETARLWEAMGRDAGVAIEIETSPVLTVGAAGHARRARGGAHLAFDEALLQRSVPATDAPNPESILLVMLRTLGDCVLATPVLEALRGRWPAARVTVLTESAYAWLFSSHPVVHDVIAVHSLPGDEMFLAEDRVVCQVLAAGQFDRMVLLSDRLDSISYHHSGLTLSRFYGVQGRAAEAGEASPRVCLPAAAIERWQARREELGLRGDYAVVHTRAGWPEKSPTAEVTMDLCAALAERHGLPVVVVGGRGESVDHPAAINLAGELSMEESAAAIAQARVFVGPDSGPLHIASAFGVPALALYGGSSLRVAPPLSPGSVAVQAPTCCPVPCGLTPCAEKHCGASGLTASELSRRLDDVMNGLPGDWWGSAPAILAESREGPSLWAPFGTTEEVLDPERFTARLASHRCARRSTALAPREAPVPVTHLQLPLDERALELHGQGLQQEVLAPHHPGRTGADPRPALDATLARLSPIAGLDLLHELAHQSSAAGNPVQALNYYCAAIGQCGDVILGERGPARPAFHLYANQLFGEVTQVVLPKHLIVGYQTQVLGIFERETKRLPEPVPVLMALRQIRGVGPDDAEYRELVLRALQPMVGEPDKLGHGGIVELASGLYKLGENGAAEELLDGHLQRLPAEATTERAEACFLRGNCRVQDPARVEKARADMEYAAANLENEDDRDNAARILGLLDRWGSGVRPATP